jgi:hypothetical protein
MPPQPKEILEIETVWIREYAKTYLPSEAGFSFSPTLLRELGLNLVALRNIFRSGRVVYSNKLDGPGAIWVVEGDDNEGNEFRLTVMVISESLAVSLADAERVT